MVTLFAQLIALNPIAQRGLKHKIHWVISFRRSKSKLATVEGTGIKDTVQVQLNAKRGRDHSCGKFEEKIPKDPQKLRKLAAILPV